MERLSFEQKLKGEEEVFCGTIDTGRGTASAETLRQRATWRVQPTARRL